MAPPTFNGKWEHGVEGITKIVQCTGDLLWLPPGWHHEVLTVKGEEHSFDIASNTIAVHFVFFWMTENPAVHKDAALAYLGGLVEEAQSYSRRSSEPRGKLCQVEQQLARTPYSVESERAVITQIRAQDMKGFGIQPPTRLHEHDSCVSRCRGVSIRAHIC